MRYRALFTGKVRGALGISSRYMRDVEAPDEESARLKLYETYEHIGGLTLTPLDAEPDEDGCQFDGGDEK